MGGEPVLPVSYRGHGHRDTPRDATPRHTNSPAPMHGNTTVMCDQSTNGRKAHMTVYRTAPLWGVWLGETSESVEEGTVKHVTGI